MAPRADLDRLALRLAERLIQLLDEGNFTATYKYAVLIGIMDLCMEQTTATGAPPSMITTRQLAEKVIELYWPHCAPYDEERGVLQQNARRLGTQAEIIRQIQRFRDKVDAEPAGTLPLALARARARKGAYERLARNVEWKLVEMPLSRLQRIGREEDRFLYEYTFPPHMDKKAPVAAYQAGDASAFDNRLLLRDGVGQALITLNGVLRPLIHRQWAMKVAHVNRLGEALLEDFLFGAARISLAPVRPKLRELQGGRCFYCNKRLSGGKYHVDHFIAWARHPDNGIHNLVAADEGCNNKKRDHLAAAEHVEHWRERTARRADDLARIAKETSWEWRPEQTLGVARLIYKTMPDDTRLWQQGEEFVVLKPERPRITVALAT